MNNYMGSRLYGPSPSAGNQGGNVATSTQSPSVTGSISATAGGNGVTSLAMIMAIAAAGLVVFYVATRSIQGGR
jgi:uncharacterized protein HemX